MERLRDTVLFMVGFCVPILCIVFGLVLRVNVERLQYIALYIVGCCIPFIIIGCVCHYIRELKRNESMPTVAAWLSLHFAPHKDRDIAERYKFLEKHRRGTNRYAFNVLSGSYKGHEVILFDYHYETGSSEPEAHYLSFFILHLPVSFPELIIASEGFFSKIAQAVGYDDIDFESHEFSRKFCVHSKDKKFAYDVCNARMIEYLLSNTDLSIEIEHRVLAIWFNSRLVPEQIKPNLNRLIKVRSLLPDYLFTER